MSRAVFLDRDGVINPLVYNPETNEYESPHYPEDFSIYPTVIRALRKLKEQGYYLFIVSNQPSYAKGKTSLENIKTIEQLLTEYVDSNGELIDKYYYCYHHPDGVIEEYTGACGCRKPGTLFIEEAVRQFGLNVKKCWFVGDRDTDVKCGKSMGMRTILIRNKHSVKKAGKETPDEHAPDIYEASIIITRRTENES